MEELKSKSQKKRDAEALKKVGVKLIDLSLAKLDILPLSPSLRHAIIEAKSIKSHGAIRRQAQLIGKLMRTCDSEAILNAYEAILAEDNAKTVEFHEIEHWRDQLIHGGKEALTTFIAEYHPEDIQQLRQLIKKAIAQQNSAKYPGATKALFRYIRACLP